MNAHDNFAGTGMRISPDEKQARIEAMQLAKEREAQEHTAIRQAFSEPPEADDLMTEALAEEMASELPTPSVAENDRGIFERSIAARRAEKAKQQRISSAALAKARQLTTSIRSLEDALDSLLASEA